MRTFSRLAPLIIGSIIVIMGISIVFGLSIPIFQILFGIFFIYLGFMIITKKGRMNRHRHHHHAFEDQNINVSNENISKEYSVAFGKANYDFSNITLKEEKTIIAFSVAFGAATIKINKDMPVKIIINSAFANAKTPDGTIISFGKHEFSTLSFDANKKHLIIEADAAFGSIEIF